jgi:hypothetical protein
MSFTENKPEYYFQKYLDQLMKTNELTISVEELLAFVELAARPKRPDGTYNYCREALEQKAKEILKSQGK